MNHNQPAWWDLLDDEAKSAARMIEHVLPIPIRELGVQQARALLDSPPNVEPTTFLDQVQELLVPTRGRDAVPARLYQPQGDAGTPRPALLYLHGGGFVLGTIDGADELCRAIAVGSGWTVVSLDYRLAPENPYPAALQDCLDAYTWLMRTAPELGIDPECIAVGGDSAGGNLATALCLHRRDEGLSLPVSQVLAYPAVDATFTTPSWTEFADAPLLGTADACWFWNQYVGPNDRPEDHLAAPMRASSLRGLPPAAILTAEVDPIRDDAEAYAARLREDGVPTSLTRYPGIFHGFLTEISAFAQARLAVEEICRHLQRLTRNQNIQQTQ